MKPEFLDVARGNLSHLATVYSLSQLYHPDLQPGLPVLP